MLLAIELSISTIGGFVVGAITIGGLVAGLYDKRRRELAETYKNLYEAKKQEVAELISKVAHLEARLELFESDFMHKLGEGISDAIVRIFNSKDSHE